MKTLLLPPASQKGMGWLGERYRIAFKVARRTGVRMVEGETIRATFNAVLGDVSSNNYSGNSSCIVIQKTDRSAKACLAKKLLLCRHNTRLERP